METVTRNRMVTISVALLAVGLVIGVIIGIYGFPTSEEISTTTSTTTTTREVTISTTMTSTMTSTITSTTTITAGGDSMTLSALAANIRNGVIDVGDDYGMDIDQRFHKIHFAVFGLGCTPCHVEEVTPEMVFAESPEGAPGPADRRICLGCHLNGPALNLYGP
jgi:hypothetical protein